MSVVWAILKWLRNQLKIVMYRMMKPVIEDKIYETLHSSPMLIYPLTFFPSSLLSARAA